MARLYANEAGELIRVLADSLQEQQWGAPPAWADSLEFDPGTNPNVLPAIAADHNGHRLTGGVLYRDGVAVTINPPSLSTTERAQAVALAKGLKQFNALASPTNAQRDAAIKANNRLTLIIGRVLLRELEGE